MSPVLHVPAFRDNYIWLVTDATGSRVIAVDPGAAEPVQEALDRHHLTLAAIFCTHHHGDHSGGIGALVAAHRVPVYGPASEAVAGVTHRMQEGDSVSLDGFGRYRVLDVPGHTRGHVAFVSDEHLFCGDTLFSGGCGRLFEGDADQLYASLMKLAALPAATRVYCGHEYTLANLRFALTIEPDNRDLIDYYERVQQQRGNHEPTLPSTIGLERRINPFLRTDTPAVRRAAERSRQKSDTAATIFATLRRWKDDFKG